MCTESTSTDLVQVHVHKMQNFQRFGKTLPLKKKRFELSLFAWINSNSNRVKIIKSLNSTLAITRLYRQLHTIPHKYFKIAGILH